MRLAIFTIGTNRAVAHADVLFQSVACFLPDADRFLVLADALHEAVRYPIGCTVLPASTLDIPDLAGLAFRYDRMEFCAALKPAAFLHLLRDQGYTHCLYFDPDIQLFDGLPSVIGALSAGASFLLTPHLLAPAERTDGPDDISVMRAGIYNLGFLGASATDEAFDILAWWSRWLRWHCVDDQPIGLFIDQKFVDLVPGFAPGARILRDPTLNVAVWNLQQRNFVPDSAAGPAVGDRALGFFHYSGLDCACPDHPSPQPRAFQHGSQPAGLQAFLDSYAQRLRMAGEDRVPAGTYAFGRFASGLPIPAMARRMFRDDYPAWAGDPFQAFEAWMHLPALGAVPGLGSAIPSLILAWIQARTPELAQFDLAQADGAAQLTRWWLAHGAATGLDPRLLAPQALAAGRRPLATGSICPPRHPARADITLVAPFRDEGAAGTLGRALRYGRSHQENRLETLDVTAPQPSSGRVLLFSLPPHLLAGTLAALQPSLPADCYKIWIPASEFLPDLQEFQIGLQQVDEIWAPTRFAQGRLALAIEGPVLHMPASLGWSATALPARLAALLPPSPYILAVADALPGDGGLRAAVQAYQLAFGSQPVDGRPILVVQPGLAALAEPAWRSRLAELPDAVVVDPSDNLPAIQALIGHAGCLLSAQRGEAIGLAAAHAMAGGVPVIATDYGGLTDLLTPETGYPVEFSLVRQGTTSLAAIDLHHAAWQLRDVFLRPGAAKRRADKARQALAMDFAPVTIAARHNERLEAIDRLTSSRA